jgi:hypothetical protein
MRPRGLPLLVVALALVPGLTHAQVTESNSCEGPEYRQLDFWVGDWIVENAAGERAGSNRIELVLKDCALHENWDGAGGGRGFSYSIDDRRTDSWHQTWVDDQGRLLQLDGRLEDGKMVLKGENLGPNGGVIFHQVTWEKIDDGRVRQVGSISRDEGDSWNTVFDGIYIPAD